eukprot:gene18567-25075_t
MEDVLWQCRTPIYEALDVEGRRSMRLVCQRMCLAMEEAAHCLTWDEGKGLDLKVSSLRMSEESVLHKVSTLTTLRILRSADNQGGR